MRPTGAAWDEDRRADNLELTEKATAAYNISFSTLQTTSSGDAWSTTPWVGPDSDGYGPDPGRMILASTWAENIFRQAPTRSETFNDSEQPTLS